ncbi:MAG: hypothetical protein K2X32_13280 [Phycisphaerales bacterium]|nr:hypothetical protein [Phycisphaerales bacterium]
MIAGAFLCTTLALGAGGCQSESLERLEPRADTTPAVNLDEAADLFRPRSARASDGGGIAGAAGGDETQGGVPAPEVDIFGTRDAKLGRASGAARSPTTDAPSPAATTDAERAKTAARQGWTIVLSAFRGADAVENANRLQQQVRVTPELRDAFVEQRGQSVILGLGRFAQASDADAKRTLEMVHSLSGTAAGSTEVQRPFASAFLAPPDVPTLVGGRPEYNLTQADREFGKDALYTLQVGVYGNVDPKKQATPADVAEFRRLAEEGATRLRKEGELAFYYHGDTKSMVTIGVFGNDAVGKTEPRALRELRLRFPHNLYNGAGIRVRRAGQEVVQPSVMVKIPAR